MTTAAQLDPPLVAPTDGAALRGLAAPTALEALTGLARLVGAAPALQAWQEAALASGCHGTDLAPAELLELAACLRAQGGAVAVFATSLSTRLRALLVLSRTAPASGDPQ